MCGCKHHHDKSALCTCSCPDHDWATKVDSDTVTEPEHAAEPFGWADPDGTAIRLNAKCDLRVGFTAPVWGEVPVWLTHDSDSGLAIEPLADWERELLAEHAEPEDATDAYVEPEPLKEGDHVLVWAKVVDPKPDSDGDLEVVLGRAPGGMVDELEAYVRADAIVRPDAGQQPPWLVEPEVEQPTGLGAVIEAIRPGDVIPSRFVRHYALVTHPGKRWVSVGGTRYSWADLENPKVIAPGYTEGGAS
jgi:hypothetical protein